MYAVQPGNRTHEVKLLSFQEAVSNLPTPKKATKRKWAAVSRPLPPKKTNFSAKETSIHESISKKRVRCCSTTTEDKRYNNKAKNCSKRMKAVSPPLPPADTMKNNLASVGSSSNNLHEPDNTAQTDIKDTTTTHVLVSNKIMDARCSATIRTALERYKAVKARQCARETSGNKLPNLEEETDGRDNHRPLAYEYETRSTWVPYLQRRFGLTVEPIAITIIEREREAARNSLQKIEEAAADHGGDNHQLFKELEDLCGCPLAYQYSPPSYLERNCGLKLKSTSCLSHNDEVEDDD